MVGLKKIAVVLLLVAVAGLAKAQKLSEAYLQYINEYSSIAVRQQADFGIPASITLAQGLLESGAGQSEFAKLSNNHFGIKCTDWAGEKIYHDDDETGECFRKYDRVEESYKDHSLFLKNRPRYAFLFQLDPTDYKSWAYGLKKAGYATDPSYGDKLIKLIEDYDLHRFDTDLLQDDEFAGADQTAKTKSIKVAEARDERPPMGSIRDFTKHPLMEVNGVRFVNSVADDTYGSIADEFNLSLTRLLVYNDLAQVAMLKPGTRVFLSHKKNKAPRECKSHIVRRGETMHAISQAYGVKVLKLYKLNDMSMTDGPMIGQVLNLR